MDPSIFQGINLLTLSSFTVDLTLRELAQLNFKARYPGFGRVQEILSNANDPNWNPKPNFTFVWTLPESIMPSFLQGDFDSCRKDLNLWIDQLTEASKLTDYLLVADWSQAPWQLTSSHTSHFDHHQQFINEANSILGKALFKIKNCQLISLSQIIRDDDWSPKLWYLGKIPFEQAVFQKVAQIVSQTISSHLTPPKKCLILDGDNTLWGGVVGDDGWENLKLGTQDPISESFYDFQKALKRIKDQGILLTLATRNDPETVLEVFDKHPESILKKEDFAVIHATWDDKSTSIEKIASELNLGLDAFVFIDDNPAERLQVQSKFPEVLVPDWPTDSAFYGQALNDLHCFKSTIQSIEDTQRTQMYLQEKQRQSSRHSSSSPEEWFESLELKIYAEPLDSNNLSRTVQLLNKTNQFNLATRRMNEEVFSSWLNKKNRQGISLRVKDRYGDYGLVAFVTFEDEGNNRKITDYVMSCRVLGRQVEKTLLHLVTLNAPKGTLQLELIPTKKNTPLQKFLNESQLNQNENKYSWSLTDVYPKPPQIEIIHSL